MADGSTRPIEEVEPGDRVIATDPESGRAEVETVTAAITGDGVKHLVTITVDTDGDQSTETADVTATDGHPFWVVDLGEWVDATDLNPGQWLRTSAGTHVQITAITRHTQRATVHNLTTANTHTYHALAGNEPILVHNIGGSCGVGFPDDPYDPAAVAERSAANRALYAPSDADRAAELGYRTRIPSQKAHFDSHRQEVFTDGKNFITRDVDGHNVTDGWKMFNRRGKRIGTYDSDLNYVKE